MGGGNSRTEVRIKHFYFGEVTLEKEYRQEFITCAMRVNSIEDFQLWEARYKTILNRKQKDALLLPHSYNYEEVGGKMGCPCGSFIEVKLKYEHFQQHLKDEITYRRNSCINYSEEELFYIFYTVLDGARVYETVNFQLGQISTSKLFRMQQGSKLQLANTATSPNERTALEIILDSNDSKTPLLLSPQQCAYISPVSLGDTPNMNRPCEPQNQAFKVGLVLLQCACLLPSEDLFLLPTRQFKTELFSQRVQSLMKHYSKLWTYLSGLLNLNVHQRSTTGECWASLSVYSEKILEFKSFDPHISQQKAAREAFKRQLKVDVVQTDFASPASWCG